MNNINQAKSLLKWKQKRLNKDSIIEKSEVAEFFAESFTVIANERKYDANYENYLAFLNGFKENIKQLGHSVYEYLETNDTVIMPMRATVSYVDETLIEFEAIMLLKFNKKGKIIEWREVCVKIEK